MAQRADAVFARPAAGWVSLGQGRCLGGFVSEVLAELASADVDGFCASLAGPVGLLDAVIGAGYGQRQQKLDHGFAPGTPLEVDEIGDVGGFEDAEGLLGSSARRLEVQRVLNRPGFDANAVNLAIVAVQGLMCRKWLSRWVSDSCGVCCLSEGDVVAGVIFGA